MISANFRSCRGVALVVVVWILALLSVIAGSLVFSTRSDLLIAANAVSSARGEAIADAGVHKAIYELMTAQNNDPMRWQGNGQVHMWEFDGAKVLIRIADESARIDINTASGPLMKGLFLSAGLADEEAATLADAIMDWRDPDDLRHPHGAEKEDYAAAGLGYGPANARFETLDELQQVLGMSEAIYRAVEPALTVHSGQTGVNSQIASRQVLLSAPGATPEMVDAYLAEREAALSTGQLAPAFPPLQAFSANLTGSAFTVQVGADLGDNTRFFREATIRLDGSGTNRPVTVLAWRSPSATSATSWSEGR